LGGGTECKGGKSGNQRMQLAFQSGTFRLRIQVTDKLGAHSAVGFVLKVAA